MTVMATLLPKNGLPIGQQTHPFGVGRIHPLRNSDAANSSQGLMVASMVVWPIVHIATDKDRLAKAGRLFTAIAEICSINEHDAALL